MAKRKMSLRDVRNTKEICSLRRDHYKVGNWTIITDGYRVWISQQAMGKARTDHIDMPKAVFDRLCGAYVTPSPVGTWRGSKFHPHE